VRTHLIALAIAAVIAVAAVPVSGASASGSAGTDVALPATDSKAEVTGRGPFKDLKVTVNQTKNLLNQAISVTWTGAAPTRHGPGLFAGNYLQLMQCWGDDDGTNPDNPGPPPEQCVAGARAATYGGVSGGQFPPFSFTTERVISEKTWKNFDPKVGFLDSRTGYVWRSFRSVDGKVVGAHLDPTFQPDVVGGVYWLNPYFNIVTTNETAAAPTGVDGKGSQLFEVTTGVESSGLGCGQQVQPVASGGKRIPKCWLVVVPRGLASTENDGTPYEGKSADTFGVQTSPLAPSQWTNRIAIPLEFNPVDTPCSLAADQTRIAGSQLAAPAVSSWQPKLCENSKLQPYVYGTINDASARQQLVQAPVGAPGLVVVSRPVDQSLLDPNSPVVYAPLTLSGTVIGFNVERNPKLSSPAEEQALATVPVARLNLTPRLLAKLLTQSYAQQVSIEGQAPYPWVKGTPSHMGNDPDFLQFNPEFEQLSVANGKNFGGFVMPATNSDAARQIWDYVLADPEAKAWLDGAADPWGMKVNPLYASKTDANPTGVAFGDPVPSSFPKNDPYCYQGPPTGVNGTLVPPPLCGTDWLPYTESLRDAARLTRAADDQAKVVSNPFAISTDQIWTRDVPQPLGSRSMLSITDSASAFQYGVQAAHLSRAGDDGSGRQFIAPDVKGFTAGVDAMKPAGEQAVLEPDPLSSAPGAYPLTVLTYGAIKPLALDAPARGQYAAFVDYASADGQAPGQRIGELPPGYAPLPAALKTQATNAAKSIRELAPPAPTADTSSSLDESPPPAPNLPASNPATASRSSLSTLHLPATPPALASLAASNHVAAAPAPTSAPKRGITPAVKAAITRFVLPVLGALALLAALGALEITKRPRRGIRSDTSQEPVD
jgi:hypothetical protein